MKLLDTDRMTGREFKSWRKAWVDYSQVKQLHKLDDKQQMVCLHLLMTDLTREKVDELEYESGEAVDNTDALLDKLKCYMQAPINKAIERCVFHNRKQKPTETIAVFIMSLRELAKDCGFGDFLNTLIKDMLKTKTQFMRDKVALLGNRLDAMSLTEFVEKCKEFEAREADRDMILEGNFSEGSVRQLLSYRQQKDKKHLKEIGVSRESVQQCNSCSRKHLKGSCKAEKADCRFCGKTGHFQAVCQQKAQTPSDNSPQCSGTQVKMKGRQRASQVEIYDDGKTADGYLKSLTVFRSAMSGIKRVSTVPFVLSHGSLRATVNFIPDTGAEISCISAVLAQKLGVLKMKIKTADETDANFTGIVELDITLNKLVLEKICLSF